MEKEVVSDGLYLAKNCFRYMLLGVSVKCLSGASCGGPR